MLTDELAATLASLARLLDDTREPWCVFGGTAMVLHGFETGPVKDIDGLLSVGDAERLVASGKLSNLADGGSDRFRSRIVLKPALGTIPVELFAGFEVKTGTGWQPLDPRRLTPVAVLDTHVFVPEPPELARIFRLFGRDKDLRRVERLRGAAANGVATPGERKR